MVIKFKTFTVGSFGKDVEEISKLLAKAGSKIKPTRTFTIGMYSAVKAFQKKNGLPPTGKVDKKTWDKLHAVKPIRRSKK